jgi:hypothetical protein
MLEGPTDGSRTANGPTHGYVLILKPVSILRVFCGYYHVNGISHGIGGSDAVGAGILPSTVL